MREYKKVIGLRSIVDNVASYIELLSIQTILVDLSNVEAKEL